MRIKNLKIWLHQILREFQRSALGYQVIAYYTKVQVFLIRKAYCSINDSDPDLIMILDYSN